MMVGMSHRACRLSSIGAGGALALVLLVTSLAAASSLDKALIRRVIAQRRVEVQACYEELLRREPTAQGKVLLRFTVTPEGKVSEAAVRPEGTTLRDEKLHACLSGVVRSLLFPKGPAPFNVTYPFAFATAAEALRR